MVSIRTLDNQFLSYICLRLKGKAYRWATSARTRNQNELLSLNAKLDEEGEEAIAHVIDETAIGLDSEITEQTLLQWLQSFLSEREYQVIYQTVIHDQVDTLVGEKLEVSRSTISRARKRALCKIQEDIEKGGMLNGRTP